MILNPSVSRGADGSPTAERFITSELHSRNDTNRGVDVMGVKRLNNLGALRLMGLNLRFTQRFKWSSIVRVLPR